MKLFAEPHRARQLRRRTVTKDRRRLLHALRIWEQINREAE